MMWFLVYNLFSVIHDPSHPDPPFKLCDTPTFADNSSYRPNLNRLLASASSITVPPSKFYNFHEGTGSDTVYGFFMCYTYSTQDQCQRCMTKILEDIPKLCMFKYEAVVWEEYCLFHYATQNLFGQLNVTGSIGLDNKKNVSDPYLFRSVVNETLRNLTKFAAFDSLYDRHAKGSKTFTGNGNTMLYAFVQCSKQLSPNDCNKCLETAINGILDCCYFSKGARVLSRGCFLRYEEYAFYDGVGESPSEKEQNPVPKVNQPMKNWIIVVVSIVSGVVALSALGCCIYCFVRRHRTRKSNGERITSIDPDRKITIPDKEIPFIAMKTVEEATNNFADSNKIGQGGFGPVFKGVLPDGREIAVKKFSYNSQQEQGPDEFINEVLLIHKLQHVNLIRLVGYSIHQDEMMLIYEYMPKGSLDTFLRDAKSRSELKWEMRLNIINGIARGMLYLHQDSRLKILHRDIKPGNILLDSDMSPKISDFGMAKLLGGTDDGEDHITARIVGTRGYMAPECATDGLYSVKTDVFSFGVLLLEIITGRRNLTKSGNSLLSWAWKLWNEGKGLELMDPLLVDEHSCSPDKFLRCMHIGLLCVQRQADDRPLMSVVVSMLKSDTVTLSKPKEPVSTPGLSPDYDYRTYINNLSHNIMTSSELLPR